MGTNHSESDRFALSSVTFRPIFATESLFPVSIQWSSLKTSQIKLIDVTEMAKLSKKSSCESKMVSRIHTAAMGKKSEPAACRKKCGKILSS